MRIPFTVIDEAVHGLDSPRELRPSEWQQDAATNFVIDSRVSTAAADRRSPEATLEAVVAETDRIKAGGGAALIEAPEASAPLPTWARQRRRTLVTRGSFQACRLPSRRRGTVDVRLRLAAGESLTHEQPHAGDHAERPPLCGLLGGQPGLQPPPLGAR